MEQVVEAVRDAEAAWAAGAVPVVAVVRGAAAVWAGVMAFDLAGEFDRHSSEG